MTVRPRDIPDLLDAVRSAMAAKAPLEVVGGGTKRGLGRPVTGHALDVTAFAGIESHEPEELVLTAGAATPLVEIEASLTRAGQQLAFEPPDYGPLYGQPSGRQTLAGVLASNLAGPRRLTAGAARDHFLGFTAVSGRGDSFKAGGRVVKNVTGYDLSKLLAGSYGTLAVLAQVTVKVLPAPETATTALLLGLSSATAMAAMRDALASSCDVSGAAFVPAGLAQAVFEHETASVTALRLEGPPPSVEARLALLRTELGKERPFDVLGPGESESLWRAIRNVAPFCASPSLPLWRLSLPPAAAAQVVEDIARHREARWFADWGGGRVWVEVAEEGEDAGASIIRSAARRAMGHAVLIRAREDVRARIPVFDSGPEATAALTRRLKESFDPHRILNPGRMYEGV
ncbi:MAG: glycolate oxidase subunit GlcE [Alphaproteobacteria bacterium]